MEKHTLQELAAIVAPMPVLSAPEEMLVYECDGHTLDKALPSAVVFPSTTEQVVALVKLANQYGLPFVARGAGTGLSGGALALDGGIVIEMCRMNKILEIDYMNQRAVVQPGLVNLHLSLAVADAGYYYAPDPSSQGSCTIGGNVAENSGGPHTLKYGVTTNHVLALEVVLPDGEVVELGGPAEERCGYDLVGAVVGAEGTTGLVTRATLRLMREPENHRTLLASFPDVDSATRAVSKIIASGIVPAAVEMMDQLIIRAVEEAFHVGLPADAGAVLIIELDGLEAGLAASAEAVADMAKSSGATTVKLARDEAERAGLWKARKRAFGAVGRLAPNYATQDGVVPRTCLPQILAVISEVSRRYELRIGNVFHAGDGNLHPIILYDEREPGQVRRAIDAGREILKACIEMGGSLTGEHGIGVEKIGEMS